MEPSWGPKNSIEIHTCEELILPGKINVKNPHLKRMLIYNNDIYSNINLYFPNLEILASFPQVIYKLQNYNFKNIKILECIDNFDKYYIGGISEELFNSIFYLMKNNNIKTIKWNIILQKYITKLNKVSNINLILISKKYEHIKYLKKYKKIKLI